MPVHPPAAGRVGSTGIQNPNVDEGFTLAGACTRNGVVITGQAVKVPFGVISDIPWPFTLLGLVPTQGKPYETLSLPALRPA
jgi:hypothetical protein